MYEGTILAIRRKLTGRGILETFNDGLRLLAVDGRRCREAYGLARAIVSDDEGQRSVESDDFLMDVAKRADAVMQSGKSEHHHSCIPQY